MCMMLLMLLIGMMCRWNLKDIFWWNQIDPRTEADLALESHHWSGEGAMEAP